MSVSKLVLRVEKYVHLSNDIVIVVVCSRFPGRKACPNYEAVEFQPQIDAI